MNTPLPVQASSRKRKFLIIGGIVLGAAVLAAGSTAWLVKRNVFASAFTPVMLTGAEQAQLNEKVQVLQKAAETPVAVVDPEVQRRTLEITEKEINAFFQQQNLGEQIDVKLRAGSATATFLLPVGENAEVGKGTTLRVSLSLGARMDEKKQFNLSVTDVSVAGLPLPNAWLGGFKGLNLLADSPMKDDAAVKAFAAGIRDFKIESGLLRVVLNE